MAQKFVPEYHHLSRIIEARKTLGSKIVATIGTWDMLHIGHIRYLMQAKSLGDILVVGVDGDETVRRYKGENRPIIPQEERVEMLTYLDCVDLVTLVEDVDKEGNWYCGLIAMIHPDVFVAVEDSYPESQRILIQRYCSDLKVLPRQAENTSSTQIIQKIIKGNPEEIKRLLIDLGHIVP